MVPPPASCEKIRATPANFPGRVLVVDDEPLVCWSLAVGLRQAGFDSDTASAGPEALALAGMRPLPEAVLIDARLHDCDPAALVRQLREIAPDCRFLLMTTDRDEPPQAPFDVVMVHKPFDLPRLIEQIGAEVSRAHAVDTVAPQH